MKIAVTGHRDERLGSKKESIRYWLIGQFKNLLACYDQISLIDGVARGVDQIAALIAISLGIKIFCYFPYRRKLNSAEEFIVENAAGVCYAYDQYRGGCHFDRDRRMVDDCDLLIVVWDGKPWGGTYYTYQYAKSQGKNILMYPWGVQERQDL